jgi:hypothetical protein
MIIALIPFLIPFFASFVLYRFSKASKLSQARIRAIKNSESYRQRLINIFSDLEIRMENAIVEVAHGVAEIGVNTPASGGAETNLMEARNELKTNYSADSTADATRDPTPQTREVSFLTAEQKRMVRSLNTIPTMKKHRIFFTEVRNSHAILISRDPRRFEIHKKGEEVLRHWAERFEL